MAREPQHLKTALAALAERGETRARDLAEAIGVAPATLLSGIKSAIISGELVERREGCSVFYRLPGQEPGKASEPASKRTRAAKVPKAEEFQAAAWADGDVDLYGLIPLDDGGHRMTPAMVLRLKKLIAWMPGA